MFGTWRSGAAHACRCRNAHPQAAHAELAPAEAKGQAPSGARRAAQVASGLARVARAVRLRARHEAPSCRTCRRSSLAPRTRTRTHLAATRGDASTQMLDQFGGADIGVLLDTTHASGRSLQRSSGIAITRTRARWMRISSFSSSTEEIHRRRFDDVLRAVGDRDQPPGRRWRCHRCEAIPRRTFSGTSSP